MTEMQVYRQDTAALEPIVLRGQTDSWVDVVADVARLASQIADTEFVPDSMRRRPAAVTACILSGRELNVDKNSQAPGWVNQRIVYTHGVGIAMVPVNEVTQEGQPNLWIKNLPPVSINGAPQVTRPAREPGPLGLFIRATQPGNVRSRKRSSMAPCPPSPISSITITPPARCSTTTPTAGTMS